MKWGRVLQESNVIVGECNEQRFTFCVSDDYRIEFVIVVNLKEYRFLSIA